MIKRNIGILRFARRLAGNNSMLDLPVKSAFVLFVWKMIIINNYRSKTILLDPIQSIVLSISENTVICNTEIFSLFWTDLVS